MSELIQTPKLEGAPSIAAVTMQTAIDIAGAYPPRGVEGPAQCWMAMVHNVAFNYPPFGAPACAGQLMPLAHYTQLFSLLGTSFGGDGRSTFALPNLRNKIAAGGDINGEEQASQLVLKALIAVNPPPGQATYPMVGTVAMFGGNFPPAGWAVADGTMLPISEYVPLFEAIGATFGGDGVAGFALPDLTNAYPPNPNAAGSAPVGAGAPPGRPAVALGQKIPADPTTGVAGLGLNYLICVSGGIYPPNSGAGGFPGNDAVLGEVVAYAGASPPAGWALCDGSLLNIADNEALYALLGTTYGGDGGRNFALPDLRGRMLMGADK